MSGWLLALLFPAAAGLFFGFRAIRARYNRRFYSVREVPDFLSDDECEHLIARAGPVLKKSPALSRSGKLGEDLRRRSSSAFFGHAGDPIVRRIKQRIADLTDTDLNQQELIQVTHYDPLQFYVPHFDAQANDQSVDQRSGMRIRTVIIYLNDDFSGGTTRFSRIATRVIPEKGKAVVFDNLTDDGTRPHPLSIHQADIVREGEKWMVNQWIRQRRVLIKTQASSRESSKRNKGKRRH